MGDRRGRITGLLLALVTLAVLAAGGWGFVSSLSTEAPPARVGEPVGVPGGALLVGKVAPEHMVSMQMGKFANAGMSGMSSPMGMDMAPEGQRRFVVDVTLAAETRDLSYSPKDFRISGKGMNKEAAPIRQQLEGGTIPAGSAISGSLVFQAPEEVKELMLSFGDGAQKVALDLKPATESDGHAHGAAAQSQGEGHSDGHDH